MSNIFVDLEWTIPAQKSGPASLISLGACRTVSNSYHFSFFRYIRPADLSLVTDKTLEFISAEREQIERAEPLASVLQSLADFCDGCDTLVIWNRNALKRLKRALKSCGVVLPVKHIVVQEQLQTLRPNANNGILSFPDAMELYSVDYDPKALHKADYDAGCLRKLYQAMVAPPKTEPKKVSPKASKSKAAPKASPAPVKKDISAEKLSAMADSRRLMNIPLDETAVAEYCQRLAISCSFAQGWIFLRTPAAYWKIEHEGNCVVTVFHESIRWKQSDRNTKGGHPFHKQDTRTRNVFRMIWYISEHDKHYINPRYIPSYRKTSRALQNA